MAAVSASLRYRGAASRKCMAVLIGLSLTAAVGGCKGGPIGGQMSARDEDVLGHQAASEIQAHQKFVEDPAIVRRVVEVAHTVFLRASKDRPDVTFTIHIIDDKEVNAFSIPGGFVYVNSGLLDKIGTDDDALACVIAHEAAHIVRHHVAKQIRDQEGKGLLVNVAAVLTKSNTVGQVADTIAQLQSLHFSREDEYEADRFGLRYAYGAGYDPAGMIRTFKILEKVEHDSGVHGIAYVQDHPITRNRILRAEEQLRELRANHGAYMTEDYSANGDRLAAEKNGISYNALVLSTTPSTPTPESVLGPGQKDDKKKTPGAAGEVMSDEKH